MIIGVNRLQELVFLKEDVNDLLRIVRETRRPYDTELQVRLLSSLLEAILRTLRVGLSLHYGNDPQARQNFEGILEEKFLEYKDLARMYGVDIFRVHSGFWLENFA